MGLKKGMTRMQIWISFVGAMSGDLLFESALLTVDPVHLLRLPAAVAQQWLPAVVDGGQRRRADGTRHGGL